MLEQRYEQQIQCLIIILCRGVRPSRFPLEITIDKHRCNRCNRCNRADPGGRKFRSSRCSSSINPRVAARIYTVAGNLFYTTGARFVRNARRLINLRNFPC